MKNFLIAKSRRLRGTPYTSRIEKQGVTAYTIYNHMLLPAAFGSVEDAYHHLKEHVQIWDVAAERQVEISGKDSAKLVQLMTCRDLSKSKDENLSLWEAAEQLAQNKDTKVAKNIKAFFEIISQNHDTFKCE